MEVGVNEIEYNDRFGSFVAKTYMWMVIGLIVAGITGIVSYQEGWWKSTGILIGTFIMVIASIFVMYITNNKLIEVPAFFVFNIGLGVGLGYIPAYYTGLEVASALLITSFIFVIFSIIAWKKPEYFNGSGLLIVLFVSLLFVIIAEIVMMFKAPGILGNPYWNGFVALIFIGFILYDTSKLKDWYREGYSEIDCAVEFILDFINLLIRILEIIGKNKD